MDESNHQSVNTESSQDHKDTIAQTASKPSEEINRERQPSQSFQSSAVVSQFEPVTSDQYGSENDTTHTSAFPTISEKDAVPIGMSASQLGLDMQRKHFHFRWRRNIRNGIYPIATLIVLVAGFVFWKYYVDGMATKTLSIGGYNYSFSFFRAATYEQMSNTGFQGYVLNSNITATVRPQTTNLFQYCTQLGDQYTQAFSVMIYGTTRPVCTAQDSLGTQVYYLGFSALNQNHGFAVAYSKSQNAKVYPKLKSIFESIKVSK